MTLLYLNLCYNEAGDKNVSMLQLSCRMSDLQFSLALSSFKNVCNKAHKGVICNMIYKIPYTCITVK